MSKLRKRTKEKAGKKLSNRKKDGGVHRLQSNASKEWEVEVSASSLKILLKWSNVGKVVKKILAILQSEGLPKQVSKVGIFLTDDSKIQELNRMFRGKDKPTDVLSFSMIEGLEDDQRSHSDPSHLGDIVISTTTARRQAKEFSVTFEEEMERLLVHGILHLHGYEHERVSRSVREKMWRKQDEIISILNKSRSKR